ncbi:DUF2017 domain-containing protein [Microbacterium sp. 1.5R]|uniref:DUF2017 domain-containing protein n=1 Tax=Microbacterium sp. 1.5R TaxID=1916917 RepID=UPI0021B48E9C|nr:DUF2017 domain-containing protein [Microbacterium sp. 1.5R]
MSGHRRATLQMATIEGHQLARLLEDFIELLGDERDVSDTAVERLTPNPYPDDDAASLAFRSATTDDLLDRRRQDAIVVRTALSSAITPTHDLPDEDAFVPVDVSATGEELTAWMRTLTALRLVIADRLGIDSDDDHDPQDDRFGIYDWLGYRLELVVQAADSLD